MNDRNNPRDDDRDDLLGGGLGKLLNGLGDMGRIVSRLNDLIDEVEKAGGEIQNERDYTSKDGRFQVNSSWRVSSLDQARRRSAGTGPVNRPASPARRPAKPATPSAKPAPVETLVDVFDEGESLQVIIELPSAPTDLTVSLNDEGTRLDLVDSAGTVIAQAALPRPTTEVTEWQLNNGIFEARLI